jgi:hypothetical protein
MQQWLPLAVTSVVSILASSGFWAWMSKRDNTKSAASQLLLGFAYDKIVSLGMSYIERGSISREEYEDLQKLWYIPYKELGGNGIAERIMYDVSRLPFRSHDRYTEIINTRSRRVPQSG